MEDETVVDFIHHCYTDDLNESPLIASLTDTDIVNEEEPDNECDEPHQSDDVESCTFSELILHMLW